MTNLVPFLTLIMACLVEAVCAASFVLDPIPLAAALPLHIAATALTLVGLAQRLPGPRGYALGLCGTTLALLTPPVGVLAALIMAVLVPTDDPRGDLLQDIEEELHAAPDGIVGVADLEDPQETLRDAVDAEPLADALRFGDPSLKRGAIARLQTRSNRKAIKTLRIGLADADPEIQALSLAALAHIEEHLNGEILAARASAHRNPESAYSHAQLGRQYLEYCYLGILDRKTKHHYLKQAVDSLVRALQLETIEPPDVLRALGRAFLELGEPARALSMFQRSLDAAPDDPANYLWHAECCFKLGLFNHLSMDCRSAIERGITGIGRDAARYWAETPVLYETIVDDSPERIQETDPLIRVIRELEPLEPQVPLNANALHQQLDGIISDISSADAAKRKSAYSALLRHDTPVAATYVVERTLAGDENSRMVCCRYLTHVGGLQAIAPLVRLLDDPAEPVQLEAALALKRLEGRERVDALLTALTHGGASARLHTCRLLAEIGGERAVLPLVSLLRDASAKVRLEAVMALRRLRDVRATRAMVALTTDEDDEVRYVTIYSLGELGARRSEPSLLRAAADPVPRVRQVAIWALGRCRSSRARKVIMAAALEDEAWNVRAEAVRRLGRLGGAGAAKALLEAYAHDRNPRVRLAASFALDRVAPGVVRRLLVASLANDNLRLRHAAVVKLGLTAHAGATLHLIDILRDDPTPLIRAAAAEALGRIGDARAIDSLEAALAHPDAQVVYAATYALATLLTTNNFDALALRVLTLPKLRKLPTMGLLALFTVVHDTHGKQPVPATLADLAQHALDNPSSNVRQLAIAVLANTQSPVHLDALVQLLAREPVASVRAAATKAAARAANANHAHLLAMCEETSIAMKRAAVTVFARRAAMGGTGPEFFDKVLEHLASVFDSFDRQQQVWIARDITANTDMLMGVALASESEASCLAAIDCLKIAAEMTKSTRIHDDLREFLGHKLGSVRAHAAAAVAELDLMVSLPDLLDLALQDESAEAVAAARSAIQRLCTSEPHPRQAA